MANWQQFKDYYSSNIRPLNDSDGLLSFAEFVQPLEWERLKAAIDSLAVKYNALKNAGKNPTAPRVPEIRCKYKELTTNAETLRKYCECEICNSTGWVDCAVSYYERPPRLLDGRKPEPIPYGRVVQQAFSCSCDNGALNDPRATDEQRRQHVLFKVDDFRAYEADCAQALLKDLAE